MELVLALVIGVLVMLILVLVVMGVLMLVASVGVPGVVLKPLSPLMCCC